MNDFYVYRHIRLDKQIPFYVGKGRDKRAFSKRNRNQYWHNIIKKTTYVVEIIKENLTESQAFDLELSLIKAYKSVNLCSANLSLGGGGCSGYSGRTGMKHTLQSKVLISENRKGIAAWNKGLTGIYSEEVINKQKLAKLGKKLTNDHKLKIKENSANKRKINVFEAHCTQFRRRGIPSIYMKGKQINSYNSITDAANDLNTKHQHIFRVLNGTRSQYKGLIFEYGN